MQQQPRGRHSASHSTASDTTAGPGKPGQASPVPHHHPGRPPRTAARSRRRVPVSLLWVAVLGIVSALVGAALVHNGKQTAFYASGSSAGPLLGSSVLSLSDLRENTAEFGHLPIVRVYYPGLPNRNAWSGGLAGANHSAVVVSFKAQPKTILSGADDATLRHFFDTAPTGHPIYYSYYHEPEDNITAGQFTLPDYKAAWARVVKLADEAHNPDLHSTLILMEWDLQKASHRDWKSYLPGGGIISTLGWDAYCNGCATNEHPQATPPAQFMGPAIAASRSVGLPYGFAEFGMSRAAGRSAWMSQVGDYLMHSGALFGSLFNGNSEYPTLRLTDSASVAVWRSFVARSGTNVPPPAPTPSPRPSATVPISTDGWITGLSASPAQLTPGNGSTRISFLLSKRGDVTICILNSNGAIVRQLSRPSRAARQVTVRYYGYNSKGQRLAAGRYPVLVVASNSGGSASAEAALTVH